MTSSRARSRSQTSCCRSPPRTSTMWRLDTCLPSLATPLRRLSSEQSAFGNKTEMFVLILLLNWVVKYFPVFQLICIPFHNILCVQWCALGNSWIKTRLWFDQCDSQIYIVQHGRPKRLRSECFGAIFKKIMSSSGRFLANYDDDMC